MYPVKQIPYALSSVASLASSYFVKGKPEADSGTSVYQPPDDSKSLKDNTKKETGKLIENESKLEFKNGILTMSKTNSLPLSQSVANQEKLANKGSKLELKDGKLQMVQNDPANAVAEKREEDDGKTKPAELLPIPQDTDWTSWIGIGLSTAALATGAYYGGGLIVAGGYGIARTYAVTYGMKHAETARQHLSFLYPIWGETQKACDERMEAVVEEMGRGKFTFKNYYIEIPREGGGDARSFIRKPPPLTSYLFKPVGSDFGNEIGAHMNIFSREQNPGHYWNLIHQTAVDVRRAVEVARDKRF